MHCQVDLSDHPDTRVACGLAGYTPPPLDDPYWWRDVPDNPRAIFLGSHRQLLTMLREHGGVAGTELMNRMVFAQLVSAFEAYLGDTLVNHVLDNPDAVTRLLATDRNLTQRTFRLTEIAGNANLVKDTVRDYLKGLIYHRLDSVEILFLNALRMQPWEKGAAKDMLFKAMEFRHDCVHRNGFDKNNERVSVFTQTYVQEIAQAMKDVVGRIEQRLGTASDNANDADPVSDGPHT
jgi:hypothetical protein